MRATELAEYGQALLDGEWLRFEDAAFLAVRLAPGADLSCLATRKDALRVALAKTSHRRAYEPPTDAQVQSVIDAAKATGMPTTALRWALQRLNETPEQQHARGCFNDEPGATMCEVCGSDL